MPKPRSYGSPLGAEKPSGSRGRPKPGPASDAEVSKRVRAEMTAKGRQPPSKAAPSKNGGNGSKPNVIARGVEDLIHPGRTTRKAEDDIGG